MGGGSPADGSDSEDPLWAINGCDDEDEEEEDDDETGAEYG